MFIINLTSRINSDVRLSGPDYLLWKQNAYTLRRSNNSSANIKHFFDLQIVTGSLTHILLEYCQPTLIFLSITG